MTRIKKLSVPKALRREVWLKCYGEQYKSKCMIPWCTNNIDVFNFHVGHDIPESKGGLLKLDNLYAICSSCNSSMGDRYTIISPIDKLDNMIGIWSNISDDNNISEMDIVVESKM